MSSELRVAILGVSGRMGAALLAALDEHPGVLLSGATASPGSRWLGQDAGAPARGPVRGVTITAAAGQALSNTAVAIDFALPEATGTNLAACVHAQCPLVLGATGHDHAMRATVEHAALHIPIVWAANMSVGVNLLMKLSELAARALDDSYDIEVFEAHHRNKKDAPSGTALALGQVLAEGRGASLQQLAQYDRHGATSVRARGKIGFSVFRGGDVVGDHTVTFAGSGERIELTHRASDRMAFARGALRAAQWLRGRVPGLYSMQDVLGLHGN